MKQQSISTNYRIVNKTNQTIYITSYGYLYGYKDLLVTELTPQINNLEKRGLIAIKRG